MIHPPQVRPEEPIAVTPHDGICGGESQQWLSYPTNPHVRFDERGRGRETERCHTRPKLPRPSSTLRWRSLALTIGATLINVRPLLSSACLRPILWDLMPRWLASDEGVHRVRSALALRRAERIDRDGTTHPCAENKTGRSDPGRRTPAGQTVHRILE